MTSADLPNAVQLREVGPREGFQFESKVFATSDKIRLIEALVESGFREIQVASFVSPRRLPQMADAEAIVANLPECSVEFTATALNKRGVERAIATNRIHLDGKVGVSASEAFSVKNSGRSIAESIVDARQRIDLLRSVGITSLSLGINAAFGCNYSGGVPPTTVITLMEELMDSAIAAQCSVESLSIADTMAWANPRSVRDLINDLRTRWDLPISLHLHDTRGLAVSNAFAALEMGVTMFDSSVGGLGGCPFGGFVSAAGNLVSEDMVHLCDELGIETGVDCERVIQAAELAEQIVGHALPGKVTHGGTLAAYRRRAESVRLA